MSIEEAIGEEDEEADDDATAHEPKPPTESRTCCQIDPLYPAMTLGRRRCRKGHSIRRTGNRSQQRKLSDEPLALCKNAQCDHNETIAPNAESRTRSSSSVSSDDDLDKLLVCHNYDTKSPLAGELLSYFDMKFCSKTTSLIDLERNDDDNFDALSNGSHTVQPRRTALSLDDLDQYTDHEDEDVFYSQDNILDILASESKKRTAIELSTNGNSLTGGGGQCVLVDDLLKPMRDSCSITNGLQTVSLDSDEGSISSGCETASTVTTTNMDEFAQSKSFNDKDGHIVNGRDASTMTTRSITMVSTKRSGKTLSSSMRKTRNDDSDSEFSDESGYVEYQESKVLI